ncbi:MAG: DUF2812 domain-containing protein [Clostridia bacterium]|nr:DUF2812 domain-containing protein [Clostridia bacterium]
MKKVKLMTKFWPINKPLPDDIEKWLEDLEAKGWNLSKPSLGAFLFHFVKGEPRRIRYCYDYQSKRDREYERIFTDLGWTLIYYSCGTYIWSMEYDGERPEAFSDYDSLISRNKRLISMFTGSFAAFPAILIALSNNLDFRAPMSLLFAVFLSAMYLFGAYTTTKLYQANKHLELIKRQKG